ncbi:hypothetical protein [Actinoplanes rectilineatus]|uniref:hypothetical protein n=1 Tax=Actinoplanes rectilineatus TaxID=113571 RepID=UPI0005F2D5F0|nr:hypothetical protein [Actinoplanes rectilineatus]
MYQVESHRPTPVDAVFVRPARVLDQLRAEDVARLRTDLRGAREARLIDHIAELEHRLDEARHAAPGPDSGRGWLVARRPIGRCPRCSDPLVRGQAIQPCGAEGRWEHVHCPDPPG